MNASIKDGVLTVTIPVGRAPSKSGKTLLIASTHGNVPTAVQVDGKPLVVSLNAYIRA